MTSTPSSSANFSQTAAYIWSLADLLRGDFKQSQYGRIILPFTLLRRLECVLEARKDEVVEMAEKLEAQPGLTATARETLLLRASGEKFYNTSRISLGTLGTKDLKSDLLRYVDSFSTAARDIFEHFRFEEFVTKLDTAGLLYKVVQDVAKTDLSPDKISHHDMGLVFEELIRRFAESSNETAGEHFTPRDIVRLTTALVFTEDDEALSRPGIVKTIYDPTAGTGGFLSSGMEYVHERNPGARMVAYGQELNPESYAICKGDMLIKGQDVSNIKLGNTLSDDQLPHDTFDYMLSNPPFGVDWKKVQKTVNDEHKLEGDDGRFGPGLPRVSDGSLLFLLHLLSKMSDTKPQRDQDRHGHAGGSRIGIILNGSPLFTGGAGSGESEIRRHLLENDLVEAIVALPTDMFYNTGIATYVWVLSNKKHPERKGRVQLIHAVHLYQKMRKSLGAKRQEIGDDDIELIRRTFHDFQAIEPYDLNPPEAPNGATRRSKKADRRTFGAKIFHTHEFGYRRLTLERPLRLSVQLTDDHLAPLRFARGRLAEPMEALYAQFQDTWRATDLEGSSLAYGQWGDQHKEVRAQLKRDFPQLKVKQLNELLDAATWTDQRDLLHKARALQAVLGQEVYDDFNAFERELTQAMKQAGVALSSKEKKQLLDAISWANPEAEPVVKKVLKKGATPDPVYGIFEYRGKLVHFEPDSALRDQEDVPLTAQTARGVGVDAVNEAYFARGVAPHVEDAWIDPGKRDAKDQQIGIVGYEIPFNRHFMSLWEEPLQAERVRLKTVISRSLSGPCEWNAHAKQLQRSHSNSLGHRVSIEKEFVDIDYLNLFFSSPWGKELLRSVNPVSGSFLSLSRLLDLRVPLPSIDVQKRVVEVHGKYSSLAEKFDALKDMSFIDPDRVCGELEKYGEVDELFEKTFPNILPYPLALLWVQGESSQNDETYCKNFSIFYEYLGLFTVSVLLGQLEPDDVNYVFKCCKKKLLNLQLTMGFAHTLVKKVRGRFLDKIAPELKFLAQQEWEDILREATNVRNDIVHRGGHAKSKVKSLSQVILTINEDLEKSRNSFRKIELIFPRYATYVADSTRQGFDYAVESLSGLALNPAATRRIFLKEPMLDGELYIVVNDPHQDVQRAHRIFPIMRLLETDDENGIFAFYFYNQWDGESEYVYVCPYVCNVPEQRWPTSPLLDALETWKEAEILKLSASQR